MLKHAFLVTFFTLGLSGISEAATVYAISKQKRYVKLRLTTSELDLVSQTKTIDLYHSSGRKTLAQVKKVKGKMVEVKLLKGFRRFKPKDQLRLEALEQSSKSAAPKIGKLNLLPEFGTSVFPIPAVGFTSGYQLNLKTNLELNATYGEQQFAQEEPLENPFGINKNMIATAISLRIKRFWAGSFYTNTGLGYRDISYVGEVGEINPSFGLAVSGLEPGDQVFAARRQDVVVDISLGNRWQSKRLLFGLDWAGVLVPVQGLGEEPADNTVTTYQSDSNPNQTYEDSYEHVLPDVSFQAKAYFGLNF